MDEALLRFLELLEEKLINEKLVKLTLSKPRRKSDELRNVYVKPVQLKAGKYYSFEYKYTQRHEVKNFVAGQAKEKVQQLLETHFMQADLFGLETDSSLTIFSSGKMKLKTRQIEKRAAPDMQHDRQKKRLLNPAAVWWFQLGLADREGNILPSMQHKFKQINRYVEILAPLLKSLPAGQKLHIVDMGAGKGYLTFALHEYLTQHQSRELELTGVEMRTDLVSKTNHIAQAAKLEGLHFDAGSIADYRIENTDVLIALHACDTATDDAIAAGIKAGAKLIVCAPCCHKQIRKAISANAMQHPALHFGILMERQAEILTDTLRALIMEYHGYKSQIMEFVELEHSPKNLLLTGVKSKEAPDKETIAKRINALKQEYGIAEHFLETALGITPF
ncbi:MAG: methyltransferase [Bacteroidetes bacterium]|nr:methyltransferase [Bacteroidota bacterium]MBU1578636.1 methyltransferase [Bacteroidota bacterium]MBU2556162.1 methyltransferase [Bacteroidota bacterium]